MNKKLLKYALIALGIYFITKKSEEKTETSGNDTKDTASNGSDVIVAAPETKTTSDPTSGPIVVAKPSNSSTVNKPTTPAVVTTTSPAVSQL